MVLAEGEISIADERTNRTIDHRTLRSRFCGDRFTLWGMSQRTPKIAVFPGQFDPITNGHLDVIRRGVGLFDELIVGVGINPEKRELFPIEERVEMIKTLLKGVEGVRVEQFSGL